MIRRRNVSIIGMDVGDRRIGLAIAEEGGTLAVPIGTMARTGINDDLVRISGIIHDRRATLIVAGLPISINGTLGPQAKKTQRFLERLEKHTEVQVETVDERYSSSEASRLMRAAGLRPSRSREQIDSRSAAIILQAYLDQRTSQPVPAPLISGV